MRRQHPAASPGAMLMALCLLRCDDCKEVRTTEQRLRLTADYMRAATAIAALVVDGCYRMGNAAHRCKGRDED